MTVGPGPSFVSTALCVRVILSAATIEIGNVPLFAGVAKPETVILVPAVKPSAVNEPLVRVKVSGLEFEAANTVPVVVGSVRSEATFSK